MKKFVALFDIHYGWEKRRVGGQLRTMRTHDPRTINGAFEFVNDFQPDTLILGGDNWNISFLSRHNYGKPRLVEDFRAEKEYIGSDRDIFKPLEGMLPSHCEKVALLGNHEYWLDMFLDQNPSVEGLIEPHKYLNLESRGWNIVDYGKYYKMGHLHVLHGDGIRGRSSLYPSRAMLNMYNKCTLSGHYHTSQSFVSTGMITYSPHISIIAPAMCALNPEYLRSGPTNWCRGFVYGYILPNGNFNVYTVIMSNYKFAAEGKLYE